MISTTTSQPPLGNMKWSFPIQIDQIATLKIIKSKKLSLDMKS